jgi:hypothetical protein
MQCQNSHPGRMVVKQKTTREWGSVRVGGDTPGAKDSALLAH